MLKSILYYPTIDIKDSTWLRCAALYWDEVCSIVPNKDYDCFSPEILYMREREQYRAIYPQDIFTLGKSVEFSNMVKRYFFRFRDIRGRQWPHNKYVNSVQLYDPSLSALIYYEKIPPEVIQLLKDGGVIHIGGNGYVETTEEFATQYMRLLAEFASRYDDHHMVIGTDRQSKLDSIYPRTYTPKKNNAAVCLMLEKCLPVPANDVGFENLLDFKENHRDDLLNLQSKLLEFERGVAECENYLMLKDHILSFRMTWEKVLSESEKMYKAERVNFVLDSIISFISSGGGMAGLTQWAQQSMLTKIPNIAVGAAVGIAGLIGIGASYRKYKGRIRENMTDEGFAYLISAKKSGLLSNRHPMEIL
jgi:hypothetical protein